MAINSAGVFLTLLFMYVFTSFVKLAILCHFLLFYWDVTCSPRRQKRDCGTKGLGFFNYFESKISRKHGSCYFCFILWVSTIFLSSKTFYFKAFILKSWILITDKLWGILWIVIYRWSSCSCFQICLHIHMKNNISQLLQLNIAKSQNSF